MDMFWQDVSAWWDEVREAAAQPFVFIPVALFGWIPILVAAHYVF